MPMSDAGTPVHLVGAGPAGLATAAALRSLGVGAVVLERGESVGAAWRARYDRLRLHSPRAHATLPGLPPPRTRGGVTRDEYVAYLERYAQHHRIEIATGVEVARIERSGEQWLLAANGGRRLTAPAVVVATGRDRTPHLPAWPGLDGYEGELQHSATYREPSPFRGREVLVVGNGSSGTEIAADLAEGGAGQVRLSVRTPRHLVQRSALGWPAQRSAVLGDRLPRRLGDRLTGGLTRVKDLSTYGFSQPEHGLCTAAEKGAPPVVDEGFAAAVRRGAVVPVAEVTGFDGPHVCLGDGGRLRPDVVLAATGFGSGLTELVGHLDQLDAHGAPLVHGPQALPHSPGLHFAGYAPPFSGPLRELDRQARQIARAIVDAAS